MEFDKIIEESLKRIFNNKCNNEMIFGLTTEEVIEAKNILERNKYMEVEFNEATGESFKMNNIVIDLEKTKVNEVVKEVTSKLGKELDIPSDFKDLIKFYSYLNQKDKRVQINFFNYDKLPKEEQALINNFFTITNDRLAIQIFFNQGKVPTTGETTRIKDDKIYYLDNREDFNPTRISHYTKRKRREI